MNGTGARVRGGGEEAGEEVLDGLEDVLGHGCCRHDHPAWFMISVNLQSRVLSA